MSKKYQGNIVEINPLWENVKLLFITTTTSNFSLDVKSKPLFLFIYENSLYFGICDYEFQFLQSYEDFTMENEQVFNSFFPNSEEFIYLKDMNPTYYKLDYQKTINKEDLGDFSDYELDLLKEWNRELSINKLLS
jgi:hypothetical protein